MKTVPRSHGYSLAACPFMIFFPNPWQNTVRTRVRWNVRNGVIVNVMTAINMLSHFRKNTVVSQFSLWMSPNVVTDQMLCFLGKQICKHKGNFLWRRMTEKNFHTLACPDEGVNKVLGPDKDQPRVTCLGCGSMFVMFLYKHRKYFSIFFAFFPRTLYRPTGWGSTPTLLFLIRARSPRSLGRGSPECIVSVRRVAPFPASQGN